MREKKSDLKLRAGTHLNKGASAAEENRYHKIIGAKAPKPKIINNAMHPARKMYCILFFAHPALLNLSENIGSFDTSK